MDIKELGQLIADERKKKKTTIKKAAKALKIKERYIEAIEEGRLSEVSEEIYPIGYIKAYAKWLGMDDNDLISKLKSENKEFKSKKELSTETSSYSYADEEAQKPSRKVLVASLLAIVLLAYIWTNSSDSLSLPSTELFENKPLRKEMKASAQNMEVFESNITKLSSGNDIIILLAKEDSWIKVWNEQVNEKITLKQGETHFIQPASVVNVIAQKPEAIEVYEEGEKSNFLGTLNKL